MAFVVGAARDLPVNQSMDWDGPASAKSIFTWAGFDGDRPEPGKAAKGFLVHDTDDPTLRGSYKLPFARVLNGKLTCLASGIRAAASRLPQTQGLSDAVRNEARGVIDTYEKQWGMDGDGAKMADYDEIPAHLPAQGEEKKPFPGAAPPFGKDDADKDAKKKEKADAKAEPDDDQAGDNAKPRRPSTGIPAQPKPRPWTDITADSPSADQDSPVSDEVDAAEGGESRGQLSIYAARVPIVATRALDMSPEEQEKIAFDPDIFAQNPPYVFRAQISNDQQDAYYTRMHPSSLRNYAQDAADGVALQNSHRSEQLPFGHSFRGRYIQPHAQGDQIAKTVADFYVVPNLQLSDVSNNHLISGIKSGTVRDVSVGFYGGRYRCTLCGKDMLRDLDTDGCQHVPGLQYRTPRPDGGMDDEMTAAAWIHDARLAEVSTVYDGATPGATIMKARRMAEAGRLNPGQARLLEARYRIRLYGSQRYFAGTGSGMNRNQTQRGQPWPKTHDASAGMPYHEQADQGMPPTGGVQAATRELLDEALQAAGIETDGDPFAALRALIRDYVSLRESKPASRLADEEQRALADGRAYRRLLIDEAVKLGVRAHAERFDPERQTRRLATMTLAEIQLEADTWKLQGDQIFPGGRQTVSDPEQSRLEELTRNRQPAATIPLRRAPDDAYRG